MSRRTAGRDPRTVSPGRAGGPRPPRREAPPPRRPPRTRRRRCRRNGPGRPVVTRGPRPDRAPGAGEGTGARTGPLPPAVRARRTPPDRRRRGPHPGRRPRNRRPQPPASRPPPHLRSPDPRPHPGAGGAGARAAAPLPDFGSGCRPGPLAGFRPGPSAESRSPGSARVRDVSPAPGARRPTALPGRSEGGMASGQRVRGGRPAGTEPAQGWPAGGGTGGGTGDGLRRRVRPTGMRKLVEAGPIGPGPRGDDRVPKPYEQITPVGNGLRAANLAIGVNTGTGVRESPCPGRPAPTAPAPPAVADRCGPSGRIGRGRPGRAAARVPAFVPTGRLRPLRWPPSPEAALTERVRIAGSDRVRKVLALTGRQPSGQSSGLRTIPVRTRRFAVGWAQRVLWQIV